MINSKNQNHKNEFLQASKPHDVPLFSSVWFWPGKSWSRVFVTISDDWLWLVVASIRRELFCSNDSEIWLFVFGLRFTLFWFNGDWLFSTELALDPALLLAKWSLKSPVSAACKVLDFSSYSFMTTSPRLFSSGKGSRNISEISLNWLSCRGRK